MSGPIKKIMLVTNEPSDTEGAEQTALSFAKQFNAAILLVDSIQTPFCASRCPSLSTDAILESAVTAKHLYLKQLQDKFVQAGIETNTKMLVGPRTSSELISTVTENKCDLVIRYLKGQSSHAKGRYGETAENLMRACPVPVLLTEKAISSPKLVACINLDHGTEENQSILKNARRLVSSSNDLSVVSCWEFANHDFLQNYVEEGLREESISQAGEVYRRLFDRLQREYDLDDLGDQVFLFNENPVSAIPKFCSSHEVDIAVMCSATLNHPLGRQLGSTIGRTIGDLPCALLAVKPIGFDSTMIQRNSGKLASV